MAAGQSVCASAVEGLVAGMVTGSGRGTTYDSGDGLQKRPSPSAVLARVGSPRTPPPVETARTPSARSAGNSSAIGAVTPGRAAVTSPGWRQQERGLGAAGVGVVGPGRQCQGGNPGDVAALLQEPAGSRGEGAEIAAVAVSTSLSMAVPIERVPGNSWCSPLEPKASGGARTTGPSAARSRAAAVATATVIRVSVSKGRCGPCCSGEPTGTSSSARPSSGTDGHALEHRLMLTRLPGAPRGRRRAYARSRRGSTGRRG